MQFFFLGSPLIVLTGNIYGPMEQALLSIFSLCRHVSLSAFESLWCRFVWVVFTFFLCSCWMDGGQSETVLQSSLLRGMHAWRLGLSVPQPVSSQASGLHTCGSPVCFDTSDAVSLNNTSFILAIKLITPGSSHQLPLPPTSTFLNVLLSSETGSFEMNHFLLFFFLLSCFYFTAGFGREEHEEAP